MPAKVNPEPASTRHQATSPFSLITEWAREGTQSFFATQRILLDLVMRQNANTMTAIRERLAEVRTVPVEAITEMAGEGVSNMIAAERVLLHLAQRENEILAGAVQERVGDSAPATAVTNAIRRSIDNLVDMQLHFLSIAAKQADLWVDSAKSGKPFDRRVLPEVVRESMETFVRAQKKFLDVITEETANWSEGVTNHKTGRKTELTELARDAAEAYIDAQKKVLDVVAQQGEVNLKTARSIFDVLNPIQPAILKEFSRHTVENFINTEKALLDIVNRPPRTAEEHQAPKGPARHKRASKRHSAAAGA